MTKKLRRFAMEILIAAVGLAVALTEAVTVRHGDLAVLLGVSAFLLAIAVAAVREEVRSQLADALTEREVLDAIPDANWRAEAVQELELARATFRSWTGGTRRVGERSSLNYQIKALRSVQYSVRAIHLALDDDALQMWDARQRGFDAMVEAYRALPHDITKRRILVLSTDNTALFVADGGRRTLTDDVAQRVCRAQVDPADKGGLGFDLRISWQRGKTTHVPDLLIIDDREACAIEGYGGGRFSDLEVSVNPASVAARVRQFEDLWTDSAPLDDCLP